MLSELIECPEGCDNGIVEREEFEYVEGIALARYVIRVECEECNGTGRIFKPIYSPPGADFFAPEEEKG